MTLFLRLVRYLRAYWFRLGAAILFSVVVSGLTLAYAWLVKPMLDEVFINRDTTWLALVPLLLMAVTVLKGAANYGQSYLMTYVGVRVITDIRWGLFHHLMRLPLTFHLRHPSSHMLSRVINDVNWIQSSVAGVLKDLVQQGLTFVFLLGYVFTLHWRLALLAVVVIPLTVFPVVRFGQRMRKLATRGQERMADMSLVLQETLTGIRIVKGFTSEAHEDERFRGINHAYFRTWMKSTQISALTTPVLEAVGIVGIAAVIWYGGSQVIGGVLTAGEFFSFLTAIVLTYNPIKRLAGANNTIQQALAAAERVFAVLDQPTESAADRGTRALPGIRQAIEFREVTFRYPGHEREALGGISFTVRPGESLALVGPSGAGKTTLVNLIPRFFEPSSGGIYIDGIETRDIRLAELRRHIGIVSQETLLFDASIRENIAYGKPDASEEEIVKAARAAYADEFIQAFPDGYATMIGEKGAKLSGGQRQRIAIARAILRDPPIMILDEATSALDSESERKVQLALTNLMKNRTTFVIAHRLSTVLHADRIAVLDEGRVVEMGSHDQLLRQGGPYQRLYALQFQGELANAPVAGHEVIGEVQR